jgi:mutator protein MutT
MDSDTEVHRVVTGALVRDDCVLLVHRSASRDEYPGVWDLPGGHIEPGESELEALTRELHEEIGVRIELGSTNHLRRLEAGGVEETVLLSAWLVGEWHGTPTNAAPEEHDEVRWFGSEELPTLAHRPLPEALADAIRDRGA